LGYDPQGRKEVCKDITRLHCRDISGKRIKYQ
jgi:hypothetical protein